MDWTVDASTAEALLTQFAEWITVDMVTHHEPVDVVEQFIALRAPEQQPRIV